MMLLRSAKRGARGKEVTKMVMKPYWMTVGKTPGGERRMMNERDKATCMVTLVDTFSKI
jgi:hypothetical protein